MTSVDSLAAIAQLGLIQAVDDKRDASDPFRLSASLRSQTDADVAALEASDAAVVAAESQRSGKSAAARASLDRIETLVREGYKGIAALRSSVVSEAERREIFAAYGWSRGLLGKFPDTRVLALARLGVLNPDHLPEAFRYAPDLVLELTLALREFDLLEPETTTGAREAAVQGRNAKTKAARQTLAQVRHWYCAASRDTSRTRELAKIGFQPQRKRRSRTTPAAVPAAETTPDRTTPTRTEAPASEIPLTA